MSIPPHTPTRSHTTARARKRRNQSYFENNRAIIREASPLLLQPNPGNFSGQLFFPSLLSSRPRSSPPSTSPSLPPSCQVKAHLPSASQSLHSTRYNVPSITPSRLFLFFPLASFTRMPLPGPPPHWLSREELPIQVRSTPSTTGTTGR
jgi:hypothetical protein